MNKQTVLDSLNLPANTKYILPSEVSKLLGVTEGALQKQRTISDNQDHFPSYIKRCGRIRYHVQSVVDYMEDHRIEL